VAPARRWPFSAHGRLSFSLSTGNKMSSARPLHFNALTPPPAYPISLNKAREAGSLRHTWASGWVFDICRISVGIRGMDVGRKYFGAVLQQNCETRGDDTNYLNCQGSVEPYAPGCPSLWWALTSVQMPQIFMPARTNRCPKDFPSNSLAFQSCPTP